MRKVKANFFKLLLQPRMTSRAHCCQRKKRQRVVSGSQLSATTTPMERNKHNAPLNAKKMDNVSKKRPGDETFINTNPVTPAHPAKKAKVNNMAAMVNNAEAMVDNTEAMVDNTEAMVDNTEALPRILICHTGSVIWML